MMLLPERVRLRGAREEDIPLLQAVYCSSREAELANVDWTAAEKAAFLAGQFGLQHRYYRTHFPHAEFQIVQYDDEDIGRLYFDWRTNELRVIDIALFPAWRGRGIGSALLRTLLVEADNRGQSVALHVEVNNPALSLYRRLGFEEVGTNGVYLELRRQPQELAA